MYRHMPPLQTTARFTVRFARFAVNLLEISATLRRFAKSIFRMDSQQLLASFFAGVFFANMVPHFVHGISGNSFPTPFSKPRGIGLSSPTTNVVWGLFNGIVGYLLAKAGHLDMGQCQPVIAFIIGTALISIMLSKRFQHKHKENQDN